MSLELFFHFDKVVISREAYSILEYFGDIGGLLDFLLFVGGLTILPLTLFKLNATLLEQLFDERTYKRKDHEHSSLSQRIKTEFSSFNKIQLEDDTEHDANNST